MKKNFWVSRSQESIRWDAVFPHPDSSQGVDALLKFAEDVLAVGEQTEVFSLLEADDAHDQNSKIPLYMDYVRTIGSDTGKYPFFVFENYYWHPHNFRISSKVSYYNSNKMLEEQYIDDLGRLMRQLHPKKVKKYSYSEMNHFPPLHSWGHSINAAKPENEPIVLELLINSDIWLPWTYGGVAAEGGRPIYDNRELALCHTPRLNTFLLEVRRLVLDLKGTWSLYVVPGYKDQVTDTGIILE